MDQSRILLIGDSANLLRSLRRTLMGQGYDVSIALDDVESIEFTRRNNPDLFILLLDFTEVPINGLDLCAQLRQISPSPIIVLSSNCEDNLKRQALDIGADDYLSIPFGVEELLARARSILRRWATYCSLPRPPAQEKIIQHGDITIRSGSPWVLVRGKRIRLTPTEFGMLMYMAQRIGKPVTHKELLLFVRGSTGYEEREYVRVFISQLRHKLEEDPMHPAYIVTEHGLGYRFGSENIS